VKRAGRTVVLTTHYREEAERLCDRVAIVDHGKTIAEGSPRQLVASLGAQHVVEFSLGDQPAAADSPNRPSISEADLLQLDGALSVRRREDRYLVESTHAHRTVPALLTLLTARGLPLAELSTHSATLEDVFVHLTGRQLRDA
jgi:ABC-2 type transport system ATP-binding protein